MNAFDTIRRMAREVRESHFAPGKLTPEDSLGLVKAVLAEKGLGIDSRPRGDSLLCNAQAVLDWQWNTVFYDEGVSGPDLAALLAHEAGHASAHAKEATAEDPVFVTLGEEGPTTNGDSEEVGYSPKERRELQANLFARELLLPREDARRFFLEGKTLHDIAQYRNVPTWLARQQLADGILLPPDIAEENRSPAAEPTPDASQLKAINSQAPTLLLEAGPGSGKTKTLIARISQLIADGAIPESILVLTYSNKAAAEISARLALAQPVAAPRVWTSTFHALGLEIARKFAKKILGSERIGLITPVDAIALLEENLHGLPLNHLKNIWLPGMFLKPAMDAISRAKDEMCGPEQFIQLANEMLGSASGEATALAEKIVEVAHIYERYQQLLKERNLLDFGDLIKRVTELIETDSTVRDMLRGKYRHVLVDEYQDVNRASVRLLQALRGPDTTLWVVGDARQSIYRFRGASDINMRAFESDHGLTERLPLETNYRSTQPIVDLFVGFATSMHASAGQLPLHLKAKNKASAERPQARVHASEDAMLAGLAFSVEDLRASRVAYGHQAVLCGTHARLVKVADTLARAGIPSLHFGDYFGRAEVRDLLCVLDFLGGNRSAIVQLAAMAPYRIAGEVVLSFLHATAESDERGVPALSSWMAKNPAICDEMRKLHADLAHLDKNANPGAILIEYLFGPPGYARSLATAEGAIAATERIAVWQLIRLARDCRFSGAGSRLHQFTNWVRRIISLERDKDFREVPEEAGTIDAVRLLTTFGSKGLEFDAVHLPFMQEGALPRTYKSNERPLVPDRMIAGAAASDWDAALETAEQECLYFVAASRAKRYLRHYLTNKKPSSYLERIPAYHERLTGLPEQSLMTPVEPDEWQPNTGQHAFHAHKLEKFSDCPRRYYYGHVLRLGGLPAEAPYFRAKNCLDAVIYEAQEKAECSDLAKMQDRLDKLWETRGPVGTPYEAEYKSLARQYLSDFVTHSREITWQVPSPIPVELSSGVVHVTPDQIGTDASGVTRLRRVVSARRGSADHDSPIFALYRLAALNVANARRAILEMLHLGQGEPQIVDMTEAKHRFRVDKMSTARADIAAGKFPVKSGHVCLNCRHGFYCPSGLIPASEVTG